MLSVILGILKIIGTVLLWILAAVLVILLLILFVPIRYSGRGSYDQKGNAEVRAGWLFRFVHFRFSYHDQPEASAGVLWFRIWKWPAEQSTGEDTDAEADARRTEDTESAGAAQATEDRSQDIRLERAEEDRKAVTAQKAEDSSRPREPGAAEKNAETDAKTGAEADAKISARQKLSSFIKKLPVRLKDFFETLKRKWDSVADKEKFYRRLVEDERNQRFFRFFLVRGRRILKDILPRKINGNLIFGFEDPYTTGQVLSYAALLLPWYHDKLKIVPVFEHKELKADLTFKGSIYLFILLINGLSIWFNRDFRRIYRKLKKRRK